MKQDKNQSLTENQRYWLIQLKNWKLSGGTMVTYATQHKLDLKAFYNWKNRLVEQGHWKRESRSSSFLPVVVSNETCPPSYFRAKLSNGILLEASSDMDAASLTRVVSILSHSN